MSRALLSLGALGDPLLYFVLAPHAAVGRDLVPSREVIVLDPLMKRLPGLDDAPTLKVSEPEITHFDPTTVWLLCLVVG